jgi:hypothetical protein
MENKIKSIVKFIESMYSPDGIEVKHQEDRDDYIINVYFYRISDSYIKNPHYKDLKLHKESMMTRDIRKSILDYLRIRTTGTQPDNEFFSPAESHGIFIKVITTK